MKRIILSLTFILALATLQAQVYIFENVGQPISEKDSLKIDRIVQHEIDFYKQIFKYDTISVKLRIFENKTLYWVYLKQNDIKVPHNDFTGKYSIKLKECIVFRDETKDDDVFLQSVAFLVNAHLVRNQWKKPPQWLVIGLGQYNKGIAIGKKAIKHEMSSYELNRIKSMIAMKEIPLKDFFTLSNDELIKKQITDEQSSYTVAHGIVYFLVEKDFEQFKQIVLKIKDKTSSYEAIDSTYNGGFAQFETDFMNYFSK